MRHLLAMVAGLGLAVSGAWPQALPVAVHGRFGGQVVAAAASDPQTFNPVLATDAASQLIASLTMADLMHINPRTLAVEPALATRVDHVSPRRWIIHLRHGVSFSDGTPFTAADVVFSFQVYTDPKLDAPGRALLTVKDEPVRATALDAYTVQLDLPGTMAVGDRLFDSVWMLPRHLLQAAFAAGTFADRWGLGTNPAAIAGLGPFRLAAYTPGQSVDLARNTHYWKTDVQGRALPYLDHIRLRDLADPNLRLTLFARGELDALDPVSSADFARLQGAACCAMLDAGAGLNAEVLVLNQTAAAPMPPARAWFRTLAFRQAVSLAMDRGNLARNVYGGHASPLASLTSPGNRLWADPQAASPEAHDEQAAQRLAQAGFHRQADQLLDPRGRPVAFSLIVPASNQDRLHMAGFIQSDLRRLGMAVQVVPLPFASYVDRLLKSHDFEAALLGIQIPDADPNEESNEWTRGGVLHVWDADAQHPPAWERELDQRFQTQLTTADVAVRRAQYRRIQQLQHAELPFVPLVAPDILAGVRRGLAGAQAALLPPHLLWNADQLYWGGH